MKTCDEITAMAPVMDQPGLCRSSAYDLGWADAKRHAIMNAFYLPCERIPLARGRLGAEATRGTIADYARGYAAAESLHWRERS